MDLIPWLVVAYAVICAVVYFGNRADIKTFDNAEAKGS